MEYKHFEDRIALFDGKREVGEVKFPIFKDDIRVINRTYVDPEYRSGGVAARLVEEAYQYLKKNNIRVVATCPYVTKWFQRYPEKTDIIVQEEQEGLGESCAIF